MGNYVYCYARVSKQQQELNRQINLLENEKCNEILTEKITETKVSRSELNRLKDKLRSGDTVIVESFSRLGRGTKELIELVNYFEEREVKLISLKENFDTTTLQGRLMMIVFQAFSQFERDLIVERTKEGLKIARARSRSGGRPLVNKRDIDKVYSYLSPHQHYTNAYSFLTNKQNCFRKNQNGWVIIYVLRSKRRDSLP